MSAVKYGKIPRSPSSPLKAKYFLHQKIWGSPDSDSGGSMCEWLHDQHAATLFPYGQLTLKQIETMRHKEAVKQRLKEDSSKQKKTKIKLTFESLQTKTDKEDLQIEEASAQFQDQFTHPKDTVGGCIVTDDTLA